MFYSKYSDYSPEQIKTEKYEALCQVLLKKCKDSKTKERMEAILYEGGFDDFSVNTDVTKNNPNIERKKRVAFAYLLATNPETFDIFLENNISLFHGTNVSALPNILKYGMKSVDEQSKIGIENTTGEEWSRIGGKRSFISFTDDIDIASDYASISPNSKENFQESFGVVIGISLSSLNQLKRRTIRSDLPEVGIDESLPLEHIKTISVPEDKVEFVQKLVGDKSIIVTPILMDEKFYYMEDASGEIHFDTEKTQKLEEKNQDPKKQFSIEEISEMSKTRTRSGIIGIYDKIKQIIKNKGKEKEDESKDK